MIVKSSLKTGVYAAVIVFILALTGIFGEFSGRQVIANGITLDSVILIVMLAIPAGLVARQLNKAPIQSVVIHAILCALIVIIPLVSLVLYETVFQFTDFRFYFQNYERLTGGAVTLGYSDEQAIFPGLVALSALAIVIGALMGVLVCLPSRIGNIIATSLGLTVIVGLLENQIKSIFTLPDALVIILVFVIAYGLSGAIHIHRIVLRIWIGVGVGVITAIVLVALVSNGALDEGGLFYVASGAPLLLGLTDPLIPFIIIFTIVGLSGAMLVYAPTIVHDAGGFLLTTLAILGLLNHRRRMDVEAFLLTLIIIGIVQWILPYLSKRSQIMQLRLPSHEQVWPTRVSIAVAVLILLVIPTFVGQYITNVFDLIALYIIMGIGLNVMVGFAGLLDLGYVASFAIGAYTVGLLTTPSFLTTGCVPAEVASNYVYYQMCTGILTDWPGIGLFSFWAAWPVAILVSAITGALLGIPVLRLRGDYLAIVTLGFGEITNVLVRANITRPIFGAAQGIKDIPKPEIDLTFLNPDWFIRFGRPDSLYYLYLAGVLLTAFVVWRLSGSRLGRAWRAIRADEDVAQAMGIHLVRTKLLAFGISSAFAGLGGGLFVALLPTISPTSFQLDVSITVLSLIIIGGLGSIPGVTLGAFILIGLPEVLREFSTYRLLFFGSALVITMILKPDGLISPPIRKLSERVRATNEGVPTHG